MWSRHSNSTHTTPGHRVGHGSLCGRLGEDRGALVQHGRCTVGSGAGGAATPSSRPESQRQACLDLDLEERIKLKQGMCIRILTDYID